MRTLVFDIAGEYGLFKKPYSPMSPVSYPLPPPPAVLGMLGAVLGLDKTAYHQRLGWDHVRIAVGLRAPVRVFRAALNLLQTKDGTDGYFRPRAGQNTHTQVPFELLRAPCFRIHVAGLADTLADELAARLRAGRTAYTVTLGAGLQIHYEETRRYHRLRIPATMDAERIVRRYQEIVLSEDGQPIRGHGGTGALHAVGPDIVAFL